MYWLNFVNSVSINKIKIRKEFAMKTKQMTLILISLLISVLPLYVSGAARHKNPKTSG